MLQVYTRISGESSELLPSLGTGPCTPKVPPNARQTEQSKPGARLARCANALPSQQILALRSWAPLLMRRSEAVADGESRLHQQLHPLPLQTPTHPNPAKLLTRPCTMKPGSSALCRSRAGSRLVCTRVSRGCASATCAPSMAPACESAMKDGPSSQGRQGAGMRAL